MDSNSGPVCLVVPWSPCLHACEMTKDPDSELKGTWLLQFVLQLRS